MAHRPVLVSYLSVYMKFCWHTSIYLHSACDFLPQCQRYIAATDCMPCKAKIVPLWFFAENLC